MNLNVNNTNFGSKLNLNTKELKIRQDSGNTIKSPIDGRIIDINKDSCEGKVVISFESGQDKYTLEICGVGRIRTNVGSKITTGYPIGVSKGDALRIKVMNHRNESVKLSEFEKDNNKSNGNSSDDNYMENGDIITSSNQNNGYDDDPDSKPSSPQSQDNNNLYDGYEEEAITFPQSTHSWLFTESIYSLPFTFAIGIVSLSYISLILALLNIFEDGEPGNRFNVPVSCSTTVRISQYIAMIIALVMEEEIPTCKCSGYE